MQLETTGVVVRALSINTEPSHPFLCTSYMAQCVVNEDANTTKTFVCNLREGQSSRPSNCNAPGDSACSARLSVCNGVATSAGTHKAPSIHNAREMRDRNDTNGVQNLEENSGELVGSSESQQHASSDTRTTAVRARIATHIGRPHAGRGMVGGHAKEHIG